MTKRILALLLAGAFFLLPGCGGREKSQSIRMDLQREVESLDPQFAESWESRVVLLNLFEGLLIRGADGELEPGAAQRYEVSPDGLTYTFHLRRDGVWNDGNRQKGVDPTPVTAADFVFTFWRMFDPEVPSPWAGDFTAIQNARQVLTGELPKDRLGVRARDDYTLVITLSEPSPILLEQLAGPGALPCNEEFFLSTRARYGQGIPHLISNGPFSLTSWDSDAMVLKPSASYTGGQQVLCPSVVLYTGRAKAEGTSEWQLFLDGKADFCAAASREAKELDEKKFTLFPAEDTVWALVFRQDPDSPLADPDIRRALAMAVDPDTFGDRVPEQFTQNASLIPHTATLMGREYRELASAAPLRYQPEAASAALVAGLERLGLESLPKLTLLLPQSAELGALGGYLQKLWQQDLRQYINLEILEDGEFQKRINAGDFQMAITPLSTDGSSPMGALSVFTTGSSRNLAAYQDPQFDLLLTQAQSARTTQAAAYLCAQCEGMLLDQAVAVPLFTQQGYCAVANGLTGLQYLSDRILFAGASRKG